MGRVIPQTVTFSSPELRSGDEKSVRCVPGGQVWFGFVFVPKAQKKNQGLYYLLEQDFQPQLS